MNLLKRMLQEEWRMHSTLFGARRFALFPVAILGLSLAIFASFPFIGFDPATIQLGMHYFLLFLGLNVGGVGFTSRSGLRNVLGDMNLLLFSTRTLPVSQTRVLTTFLAKDMLYYFGFFVLPIALGGLAAVSPATFLLTLVSYLLAFLLGVAASLVLSVAYVRIGPDLFAAGIAATAIGLAVSGYGLADLNPAYLFYLEPGVSTFLYAAATVSAMFAVGVRFFGYAPHRAATRVENRFTAYQGRFDGLVAKNLLDLKRSSGGYGKILFSFGIMFAVFWFMMVYFPLGEIFLQAPLLSFAVLIAMAAMTVYNWLNQFDAARPYLLLPLTEQDVIQGKIKAYFLISVPLVVAGDFAAALIFGASVPVFVHALLISLLASTYILAITVHLTGLQPNVMLLDVAVLLKFIVLSSLLLIPLLITGVFYPAAPGIASGVLAVLYLLAAASSGILLQGALPAD